MSPPAPSLKAYFHDQLQGTNRLAILGAGSELKADDAAGVAVAQSFIRRYSECCSEVLRVFNGSTAPENFSGAIKDFRPDHLLLIDAADILAEPGSICTIEPDCIAGVSFSTHMLPLKIFLNYLAEETGCKVTVIGIQPQDLTFGAPMSEPVQRAVRRVIRALGAALREQGLLPA
jgi:hydrogenase 3 maturation protease